MGELLRKLRKLAVVGREPAYRFGLRHGVAAAVEHEGIPLTKDFKSVVDVGAGRGQFALVAHRRFPRATLHCFEPLTEARKKLTAVTGRLPAAHIYDLALGSGRASVEFHVSGNLDSSSILSMTASHITAFPGSDETGRVTVPVARLDGVLRPEQLPSPSLLKIDVQGYELEVLRGAEELLERFDVILVECSFVELYAGQAQAEDVIGHLRERGFRLAGVFSPAYDAGGRCLQADALFERRAPQGTYRVPPGAR